MKRYKLIKKLPFEESPEVGYISTPCCMKANKENGLHYWSHYWNHNWFNPKDYPEYWEEMIEKDYEVLSLEYDGKIYYKSTTPDPMYSEHFKYVSIVNGWVSMMSVIKPMGVLDRKVKIHSIKRLSDGEVFTIGDMVPSKIVKFKMEGNEISIDCGGAQLSTVQPIKNSQKRFSLSDIKKAYHLVNDHGGKINHAFAKVVHYLENTEDDEI